MMLRAIDIGYGHSKAKSHSRELSIPSVVGTSRPLFENNLKDTDPLNSIIYLDNNRKYFVGNLAINQSPFKFFNLTESKPESRYFSIFLKTMLGLLSESDNEQTTLITGLPVSLYFTQKDKMESICTKRHEIRLKLNKRTIERTITVLQTHIYPQPFGSAMDWLLDETGRMKPQLRNSALGTILVVDVGFYTTDYFFLDNLEPNQDYCRSTRSGIHSALKSLADRGIDLPLFQLDKKIREGHYQTEADEAFRNLAEQIHSEIETFAPGKINTILLTGGGGVALHKYLNLTNATLLPNSDLANVRGYYKLGKRLQK